MAKTYAELPEAVIDFLSHPDGVSFAGTLLASSGVPEGKAGSLLTLVDDIVLGNVPLLSLPDELAKLGIPAGKAQGAAVELATARLLPVAREVGDVAGAIKGWGGSVSALPPGIDAGQAAAMGIAGFLAENGIKMEDDVLQKRLEFQLALFVRGERELDAAVAMMMRPSKVGGLDMPESDARALLAAVQGRRIEAVAEVKPPTEPQKTETSPVLEKKEAEMPLAEVKPRPAPIVASVPTNPSAPIPDQVAAAAGLSLADPDLKKRFDLIVDARLKDVRDAFETRAALEQPMDKGGLGISGAALAAAMEALEALVAKRGTDLAAAATRGKMTSLAQDAKAREEKERAARASEEAALAKRYAELTGLASEVPVAAPLGAVKAAAAARVSAATVPASAGRPKLDDVRSAPRLSGPLDELRGMTMDAFRRLSKDPAEAARKVKAKVALLEEQGYEQRIAAIKAWRESAVHRLYVAVSQEAVETGRPVSQVAEARRASMPGMFTAAELAAVIQLNGELRF